MRAQLTLGGILQGVVPVEDYPWEDLDLGAADDVLADASGGLVSFVLEIDAAVSDSTDYEVDVQLPTGFRYVPGSLSYPGAIVSAGGTGNLVSAVLAPREGVSLVQLQARAPTTVGYTGTSAATLTTTVGGEQLVVTATGVDQVVAEAFEPNDTPATATPIAPGSLYLTHIATTGDEDWFAVEVENDGARLSAIVSNLDADFDLAVFGPAAPRLRKASRSTPSCRRPTRVAACSTGARWPRPRSPTTSTSRAPAGHELLGVSARRGLDDEDVATDGLAAGHLLPPRHRLPGRGERPAVRAAASSSRRRRSSAPASPARCRSRTTRPRSFATHPGRRDHVVRRRLRPDDRLLRRSGGHWSRRHRRARHACVDTVNAEPERFAGEVAGVLDVATLPAVQTAYDTWDERPVHAGQVQRRRHRDRRGDRRRCCVEHESIPVPRARRQRRPDPVRPRPRRHDLLQRARVRRGRRASPRPR